MLKKSAIIILFTLTLLTTIKAQTSNAERGQWFKEAKFGMMVHWGLYSILEGSYNGHTLPDTTLKHANGWYAEWAQQRLEVPAKEYQALVKQFNPVNFDAGKWIFEAKNAGMKYFVITAKHHDGFALWDSKVSTYDIGSAPYKKDILGELAKACKKYGLKFGFYYSHCEDWEHPGGATPEWLPRKTDAQFEKYWNEKCLWCLTCRCSRYSGCLSDAKDRYPWRKVCLCNYCKTTKSTRFTLSGIGHQRLQIISISYACSIQYSCKQPGIPAIA